VIITDPHIAVNSKYPVYADADRDYFVKDCKNSVFEGNSWPGKSVWIDYLNYKAQNYWANLYSAEYFVGTNELYDYWVDMNEPSVFDSEQGTMPYQNRHTMYVNGTAV